MNKNKVQYHFEAPNRVVATISECSLDAFIDFNRKFLNTTTSAFELWADANADSRYIMPDTFTATAYCSPEDTFDWETGKRVAYSKLSDAYTESLNKHIKNIQRMWDKVTYQWTNITCWNGNIYWDGK